jgi:N-glycosylase/DNA lyase
LKKSAFLPQELKDKYKEIKSDIDKALREYAAIPDSAYFYELCFCILTPQSRATNAWAVQQELMQKNFFEQPFDAAPLLADRRHYIRFHNQKAKRLLMLRDIYPAAIELLKCNMTNIDKRNSLASLVNGYGMKEASHLMRNIGYRAVAILDRHILNQLVECGVYPKIPKVGSKKQYLEVEQEFLKFADQVNIPIDELDLLFWSYNTGEILK